MSDAANLEAQISNTIAELGQHHRGLGRELPEGAESLTLQLAEYLQFLERWTKKIDLVSQESGESMVIPHIADSIAAFVLAAPSEEVCCDVGSGAGLPGIVWAMLRPEMQVVLLEPRKRRVDFLKEVRRVLALKNVDILDKRIEEVDMLFTGSAQSCLFVCRALGMEQKYLEFAQMHCKARVGRALVLAGPNWECPSELSSKGMEPSQEIDYSLLAEGPKRKLVSWDLSPRN